MTTTVSVVRLSSKNQIVLSKAARNTLGVKPRAKLILIADTFGVRVVDGSKGIDRYRGIAHDFYKQFGGGAAYLKKERATWGN